jgi:hypothetical protein
MGRLAEANRHRKEGGEVKLMDKTKNFNIVETPILAGRCIYCKKGSTKTHPMLYRANAPGEYWQHWDFEKGGCEENTNNINPNGNSVSLQPDENFKKST